MGINKVNEQLESEINKVVDPESLNNTLIIDEDAPAKRATKRRAMFFEKVGGGKEIPFKTTIILCRLDPKGDYFTTGTLVSKTETAEGFQYLFNDNQVCKDCFQENNPVKFDYWLQPVVQ